MFLPSQQAPRTGWRGRYTGQRCSPPLARSACTETETRLVSFCLRMKSCQGAYASSRLSIACLPAWVWPEGPVWPDRPPVCAPSSWAGAGSSSRKDQRSQRPWSTQDTRGWTWKGRGRCPRWWSRFSWCGSPTPPPPPPEINSKEQSGRGSDCLNNLFINTYIHDS